MKSRFLKVFAIAQLAMLTGCWEFTYQEANWQGYCIPGQPGPCISHHCESICHHCSSNEPICKPCWECLKADGCMQAE